MGILLDAFDLTPASAVEYLRKRKLRISGSWIDIWKEQHTRTFTVANMMCMDLLQNVRHLVDKAIDGELAPDATGQMIKRGISFQEFKKRLIPELKKSGWWGIEELVDPETGEITERRLGSVARLKTIYNTNVQTAFSAGRYNGQMNAVADLPYWEFVAIVDGSTTDRCRRLHRFVRRYDDPVWDVIYPPNHWGCRSRVRSLTTAQVERLDIPVDNSIDIITRKEFVGSGDNKHTVDVRGIRWGDDDDQVYWCGAGWDYNPGKTSFTPDLTKYDADIAALWGGQ